MYVKKKDAVQIIGGDRLKAYLLSKDKEWLVDMLLNRLKSGDYTWLAKEMNQ